MVNFFLNIVDGNKWKQFFQKTFLFWVLLCLYIPLAIFVLLSFNEPSSKETLTTEIKFAGLQNYISFFTDSSFSGNMIESFFNSLTIAFISVPISLFLGILVAISIWKNYGHGKKFVFMCCNASISSPDIVQAIAFLMLFSAFFIPLGFFTVILSHIAISIPYVIVFVYPKLNKIKKNLLFASYDMKFGFFESILEVIVPMLIPSILGSGLIIFTISFDDFIITNLVRGNVSTVASEIYGMKNGIKAWTFVFGSLIILVVIFCVIVVNLKSMFFNNKDKDDKLRG